MVAGLVGVGLAGDDGAGGGEVAAGAPGVGGGVVELVAGLGDVDRGFGVPVVLADVPDGQGVDQGAGELPQRLVQPVGEVLELVEDRVQLRCRDRRRGVRVSWTMPRTFSAAVVAWVRMPASWPAVAGLGLGGRTVYMAAVCLSVGVRDRGRGQVAAVEDVHGWGMGLSVAGGRPAGGCYRATALVGLVVGPVAGPLLVARVRRWGSG